MGILVVIGAAISLLGMMGIVGCGVAVYRARRAELDDETMRARLQTVVAWNLGFLALSAFGLMMVVLGVILT